MTVDVRFTRNPLAGAVDRRVLPDGLTVRGIIDQVTHGAAHHDVFLVREGCEWQVRPEYFERVRPKPGTIVVVRPHTGASALVSLGASFLVTTFGIGATAATIISGVAIAAVAYIATRALMPSPVNSSASGDPNNPTIRGLQNGYPTANSPVPMVLGRRRMAAVKSATGYSELVGQRVFRRERMTFGVGPVALEDLKIGTTPIHNFSGVSIQLRNVDQTETLARIPQLANMNVEWLDDADTMTLYSRDIFEDAEGAKLDHNVAVIRSTPADTLSARVHFYFAGLVKIDDDNQKLSRSRKIGIYYRPASGGAWTTVSEKWYQGKTTATLRFGEFIQFPSAGEYEIKVIRLSADDDDLQVRDDSYLEAIHSEAPGTLPSPSGVAEIALRVKATDQIQGQLDPINAVVNQMAPRWDGATWTDPEPIRHPADIYVELLRGKMRKRAQADASIDLASILAWKTANPAWAYDQVVLGSMQLRQVIDEVLAAGLAMYALKDGQHSLITDQSKEPAVQVFTPRNVANLESNTTFPAEVHGLRVPFIAEDADWGRDEVVVYANGYDENTATPALIETAEPGGFVVTSDGDVTNVAKWAYYHLAQVRTRPTELSFDTELDHLMCGRGDPVIFQADLLSNSFGQGRILSILRGGGGDLTHIRLDDVLNDGDGFTAHLLLRSSGGVIQYLAATYDAGTDYWVVSAGSGVRDGGTFDDSVVAVGDLATIFEHETEPQKWLVKEIAPDFGERARVTLVEASEVALDDLSRPLPTYDPKIVKQTSVRDLTYAIEYDGPQAYVVLRWFQFNPQNGQRFRVILEDGEGAALGQVITADLTARFPIQSIYSQSLTARVAAMQPSGAWGVEETITVSTASQFDPPDPVDGFQVSVLNDTLYLSWDVGPRQIDYYTIRYSPATSGASWSTSVPIIPVVRGETATAPAQNGSFLIKPVTIQGVEATLATMLVVNSADAYLNAVETAAFEPDFGGTLEEGLFTLDDQLMFASDFDLLTAVDILAIGDLLTHNRSVMTANYTPDDVIDLGAIYTARVASELVAVGYVPGFNILEIDDLLVAPDVLGATDGRWSVVPQISTTEDDTTGTPTWSDWSDLVVGDYRGRGFRFRFIASVTDPQVLVKLSAASVSVDMPDRIEKGQDVAVPLAGATVTFSPAFRATPSIVIDPQGLPSGGTWERSGVSKSGFSVTFRDKEGSPVAGTMDYTAVGYGREGA